MRYFPKCDIIPASLVGLQAPESSTDINSSLYKGEDVKKQLIRDQHGKCVYCECFINGDFGDIEHYRPKKGYTLYPDTTLRTGYYWLAYEWSNLLLSCSKCNRNYKKNHFLLSDETKRDIPNRNINNELPLLINPSSEDPHDFIIFHRHIAAPRFAVGPKYERAKHTIELLKLNDRNDLKERRYNIWKQHEETKHQLHLSQHCLQQAIDTGANDLVPELMSLVKALQITLNRFSDIDSEYSAMFLD